MTDGGRGAKAAQGLDPLGATGRQPDQGRNSTLTWNSIPGTLRRPSLVGPPQNRLTDTEVAR